ncbi:ABC transporter substrate-binding protein [Amycolatopsis lurida]
MALLAAAACGGTAADSPRQAPGAPVSGGTARVLQITEPRSLDPALMGNAWAINAFLGNALYGTLMTNKAGTGEIAYTMAESFTTDDNGATFELKLRQGLTFSDGSPLNAEAVKFNWDRIRDPAVGSSSIPEASMIAGTEVLTDTTVKVALAQPIPNYAQAVATTALNWIGAPATLRAGQREVDSKPVGAGPYALGEWTRQDKIELVRNPKYWDAPKPYLDRITLRTANDSTQRINTLISGGADLAIDTNWATIAKARDSGLETDVMPLNGGQYLAANTRRAPFNDVRARKAVAAALDLDAMDQTTYNGKGEIPHTLFQDSSPFYADTALQKPDRAAAQRLFDELAAEGKPVSFTFTSYPSPESKAISESVQAQLSTFGNVAVSVRTVDHTEVASLQASKDFELIITSALFIDPEPRLWSVFHSSSRANMSGINDPGLDASLDAGRKATSQQERKAAYDDVQRRLADLAPGIFYTRGSPAAVFSKDVYGVVQYGHGSLLPEELWLKK